MNYTKECREIKQSYYGGYCNMCRDLGIEIKPYHSFEFEDHEEVKKLMKKKRKEEMKNEQ